MNVPHYYQETEWTCGPAVMRMILESLGSKKTEKQLIKLMKANKVVGTRNRAFSKIAERYKLNYAVMRNATIDDLKYYYKHGFKIVVCYYVKKWNFFHFAVVEKMNRTHITFLDPYIGPEHEFKLSTFSKVWVGNEEWHWFFAVKK